MVSQTQILDRLLATFLAISTEPIPSQTNLLDVYENFMIEEDFSSPSFAEWISSICDDFGVKLGPSESDFIIPQDRVAREHWESEIKPRLTCGDLAERIWSALPQVSFEPVSIAGRNCGPAGAFFGLAEVVRHVDPHVERFSPSCQILQCLQGTALKRFWAQVRVQTGLPLPELTNVYEETATRIIAVWALLTLMLPLSACVTAIWGDALPFLLMVVAAWVISLPVVIGGCLVRILREPRYRYMPLEIESFRDLAEYVSARLTLNGTDGFNLGV